VLVLFARDELLSPASAAPPSPVLAALRAYTDKAAGGTAWAEARAAWCLWGPAEGHASARRRPAVLRAQAVLGRIPRGAEVMQGALGLSGAAPPPGGGPVPRLSAPELLALL